MVDHTRSRPAKSSTEIRDQSPNMLATNMDGLLYHGRRGAPDRVERNPNRTKPFAKDRVTACKKVQRSEEGMVGNLIATVFEFDLNADPRRGLLP
jgi:hypothetical protein